MLKAKEETMKSSQIVAITLLILMSLGASVAAQTYPNNGLVTVESAYSGADGVQLTADKLVSNLEEKGLTVMAVVDHAANAANVDLELPPTQLIIFGNPNLGTQLMNNSQSVAIDLPQKYLVWSEASSGRTFVSYNGVPYLTERHALTGPEEVLQTVTGALANFANSITAVSQSPSPTAAPDPTAIPTPSVLPVTGGSMQSGLAPFWVALALLAIGFSALLVVMLKNRTVRLWGLAGLLVLTGFAATLLLNHAAQAQSDNGLVALDSSYSVAETVSRLESEITARGLTIMRIVDHAANAATVDRALRPTQLILFGNPKVGTPLMQANRTIGIDLPQKMLVWEDADGDVHIAYNAPDYLRLRHNILGRDQVIANVTGALSAIAQASVSDVPVDVVDPTAVPEPTTAPVEEPTTAPVEEPTAEPEPTADQTTGGDSAGDYAEMLQTHNAVRAEVGRPAYTWSNELQQSAQNWSAEMATIGYIQHDPDLYAIPGQFGSENVSLQVNTLPQSGVVNDPFWGWANTSERESYAASNGCSSPTNVDSSGRACGHYKTIISSEFTQVGCGATPGQYLTYQVNFWVCRYR